MNKTHEQTLCFGALLRDVQRLTKQDHETLVDELRKHAAGCAEIDQQLLIELLTPKQNNENIRLLDMAEDIVGWNAAPEALHTPLISVFTRIELNEPPPTRSGYRQTLWSEDDDNAIFPCEPTEVDGKALLQQWRHRFVAFFESAKTFDALYAGTMGLIDEYLWCVPIDAQQSDISLAEIVRLKSAVAACLCKQNALPSSSESTRFTLVVGDLSGIQDYVFEITEGGKGESGTAKRLRSRSLFVQLLAEIGMQRALAEYKLPPANILMASGGKFHVLWPYRPDNQDKLQALQKDFDTWLLKELHGEIGLIMAQTDVKADDFRQGFGMVIDRAERALWDVKNRKFASVLQAGNTWNEDAFVLRQVKFPHGDCPSCKKFPRQSEKNEYCTFCELDKNIGRQIAIGAKYLVCYAEPVTTRPFSDVTVTVLNRYVTVLTDQREIRGQPELVLQLGGKFEPAPAYPVLWRAPAPYVVKEMDFTKIAESGNGRALLGYFKADADHLGKIFEWGLREIKRGDTTHDFDIPARFSMLSKQLDRFFGAWLSRYLRTTKEYQNTYTVFAGGDDVFLVGHWQTMVDLANDLRLKFQKFVSEHEEITLSAGIALVKPRVPSGLASKQAEEQLKKAKNTPSLERQAEPDEADRKGRAQIALLGDVIEWDVLTRLLKEKEEELLGDDYSRPNSALLYHLIEYARMWQQFRKGDTDGLRFQPLLAYNVRRNVNSYKQPILKKWADRLVNLVFTEEKTITTLNHLGLITTLTIFEQHQRKEEGVYE